MRASALAAVDTVVLGDEWHHHLMASRRDWSLFSRLCGCVSAIDKEFKQFRKVLDTPLAIVCNDYDGKIAVTFRKSWLHTKDRNVNVCAVSGRSKLLREYRLLSLSAKEHRLRESEKADAMNALNAEYGGAAEGIDEFIAQTANALDDARDLMLA